VDDVDRRLIDGLRGNARATYAELARRVGLSPPAVHERVAKLEASGVITGYHAAVAPAAVGLGVSALVGIRQSEGGDPARIAGALEAMPEIEDCWVVAGDETFVVKVRVPDVPALEHVIAALTRIRGVARTRTTVVLSTRFEGRVRAVAAEPGPGRRPPSSPPEPRPGATAVAADLPVTAPHHDTTDSASRPSYIPPTTGPANCPSARPPTTRCQRSQLSEQSRPAGP